MAEEKIKIEDIMRDFIKTIGKRDVEKALSYLTEDVDWVTPSGTLKGKDELRCYLSSEPMQDLTITETGNGIITQGNKAFFEHVITATFRGRRTEGLAICAYEFKGDKIEHMRTTLDRLLLAQQATGGLAKIIVNQIVKQSEELLIGGKKS